MTESTKGFATITDGEYVLWAGKGKVSVSASRAFDIKYGVDTSVKMTVEQAISLGFTSQLKIAGGVSVSLGGEYKYEKTKSLKVATAGEARHINSYVITVDADTISKARYAKWQTVLQVMIGLQVATTMGLAIFLMQQQIKYSSDGTVKEVQAGALPLSSVQSIVTGIATLMNIILMIVVSKRFSIQPDSDQPRNALTMDKSSGTFLGVRTSTPLTSNAAGINLKDTGIHLGTAKNLAYDMSAEGTAVGFTGDPGLPANGGTGLKLGIDGTSILQGNTLALELAKPAGGVDSQFSAKAQTHVLTVTDDANAAKPAHLSMAAATVTLQQSATSSLVLQNNDAQLISDNSSLKLASNKADLIGGASQVNAANAALELKFGANVLKIDASGFNMNNDLTVIAPTGPIPVSALAASQALVQRLQASLTAQQIQLQVAQKTSAAAEALAQKTEKTLIDVRNQVEALSARMEDLKT